MNVNFVIQGSTIAFSESMDHLPDKGDRIYIDGIERFVMGRTFHQGVEVDIILTNVPTGRSL